MIAPPAAARTLWHRYHTGIPAQRSRVARIESTLFASVMFVALIHFLDATTFHAQSGASPAERAAQTALAFAIPFIAAFAYPYLKCGWRITLNVAFSFAAISTGLVIHVIGAVKNGPGSGDYTGFAWLAAGIVLLVMTVPLLFASLPGWRWRLAALPAGVVVVMLLMFPATVAVYITHAPRYEIGSADLGRAYEDVGFETADGLTIRGWYVPSENGAAVILLHGSGGARVRPLTHARMLAARGYGVLLVDTRGHGESEGTTNAVGWGAWPDVEAAAAFLDSRPDVQHGRVGVLGISMGAEIGLDAASHVDTLRVVVADGAGIRSLNELQSLPLTWRRAIQYPNVALVSAVTAMLSGTSMPPALEDRVGLIETPTLLISSNVTEERDSNRIWHARMSASAELWELPDTGHTAGLRTHPQEYEARVMGFLDAYLLN